MALLFTAPKISFCWYTVSLAGQRRCESSGFEDLS
ncbi:MULTISPECIES: hypothetical protein [Klebsiella]|nr:MULTISPECIES: hypothetical protein [Klebsiella]EIV2483096.1 hypothetical protein [Klebsiella aerogenes]EJL5445819.1 hypothetical protein [Klebsiella aerogenes]EKM7515262.1 hypothetical protein [Klebsiella aerogenes]EKU6610403.1 hypothetical protein [Klebsiella aerogenes]EKU8182798.1 hypothetical protein [Klebsiella aerogenes]